MANKKISELVSRTPSLTDLMLVGDPSSGYSYKCTITELSTLLEANITLNDLNDVVITAPTNGQVLTYNGTNWVNGNNGITEINGLTAASQSFAVGTSGTDFAIVSSISTHTFNLPTASATNRGALSSADWSTFNSKIGGSGTTNYLSKFTGTSTIGNSLLFDNGTNVGIGTTNPQALLTVAAAGNSQLYIQAGSTALSRLIFGTSTFDNRGIIDYDNTSSVRAMIFRTDENEAMRITSGGNVGIGTSNPAYKLDVNGDASSYSVFVNGGSATGGALRIKQYSSSEANLDGYNTISTLNTGVFYFTAATTSPNFKSFVIDPSGLSENTLRTFTLPNASGTIALTSNITSAISGTTNYIPKFTSSSAIGNSIAYIQGNEFVIHGTTNGALNIRSTSGNSNYLFFTETGVADRYLIGSPAGSGDLVFRSNSYDFTNGSERMRLTSGGSLGIGTSTPQSLLQVGSFTGSGGFAYGTTATFANSWVSNRPTVVLISNTNTATQNKGSSIGFAGGTENTSSPYILAQIKGLKQNSGADYSGYLAFYTTPASSDYETERMRLDASGNLGLGTSSPTAVNANRRTQVIRGTSSELLLQSSNATDGTSLGITYTAAGNDAYFVNRLDGFYSWITGAAGNTERMRLTASGNLGLGTSSPESILHIAKSNSGGIGAQIILDNNGSTALNNAAELSFLTDAGASGTGVRNARIQAVNENASNGAANLQFWTWNGSTDAERLRLTSGGNLGLGVTPSAWATSFGIKVIDVGSKGSFYASDNDANVSFNQYFDGTNVVYKTTGTAGRYAIVGNQHEWRIAPSGTAGNAISFTQAMTLNASGNLGIGTTNPAEKLDVVGRVKASIDFASNNGTVETRLSWSSTPAGVVGTISNHPLEFYTNATAKMTLSTSGNLGLGITPSAWISTYRALQIGFGSSIVGRTDNTTFYQLNNAYRAADGTNYYLRSGENATQFVANLSGQYIWYQAPSGTAGNAISFTQAMTLDASGRLGIGITNPSSFSILDANGQIRVSNLSVQGFYQARTSDVAGSGVFGGNSFVLRNGATSEDLNFDIFNRSTAAWYTPMIIKNSTGNVGIGTSSPTPYTSGALVLNQLSSNANSEIKLTNSTTGNAAGAGLLLAQYGVNSYLLNANSGVLVFGTSDAERMRITSGGNVGIGTTGPVEKLDVRGKGYFNNGGALYLDANASNTILATTGARPLLFEINSAERMRITSGGLVGIGITTPNSTLHANGSVSTAISIKTGNYTLGASDYTVVFDISANTTATLPDATTCTGRIYTIKANVSNTSTLTIDGNGSQTIDGNTTLDLNCKGSVIIQSDGSNWRILSIYLDGTCL